MNPASWRVRWSKTKAGSVSVECVTAGSFRKLATLLSPAFYFLVMESVMKSVCMFLLVFVFGAPCYGQLADLNASRYHPDSINNPYGAGSRYKVDGLMNPYSQYGSRYSNDSWRNPYATNPPKIYSGGRYVGELSINPYRSESVLNSRWSYKPYRWQSAYVYPGSEKP